MYSHYEGKVFSPTSSTTSKNMDIYELSNQYLSPDFPLKFRNLLVNEVKAEEEFALKVLHEIFDSGTHRGKKMVEVGCGPTIHQLASASKYYTEIITGDYSPANRESVEKWLSADPQCLDWSPLLETVARLEGYSNLANGVKEIQTRIRSKLKSVVHCDVLDECPLPSDIKDIDLLFTSSCLESSCHSIESFVSAMKKLGNYVHAGGSMIMVVVINISSMPFDGKELKVLNVDLETVERAFREAGFKKDRIYYRENEQKDRIKYAGVAIITGTKQ